MKRFLLAFALLASAVHAERPAFVENKPSVGTSGTFSGLNDTSEDTIFTYSPTSGVQVAEALLDFTNMATTVTCTIRVKRTFSGSASLGTMILLQGLTLANAMAGTMIWTRATDALIIPIKLGLYMVNGDSVRVTAQCSLAEASARSIPYAAYVLK